MILRNETKEFLRKPGSFSCRAVFVWVAILLLLSHTPLWAESQLTDSPNLENTTENTWDNGLQVRLLIGKKARAQNILTYALRYEQFPALAAAFLYLVRQEPKLYKNVQYHSKSLAVYGNPFISLPDRIHSLPNFRSVAHPQAGLAFWRNGSVLRSDILALHTAETAHKDQKNLVFFADLLGEPDEKKTNLKHGFQFISVEAASSKAQNYLDSLAQDQDAYQKRLEQDWQSYIQINWPEISVLLENGEGWQRNEFGYYYRPIIQGQRALPKIGEDLNITLEQRDFAGLRAQSLPVIVAFGKDTLPMPFPYFVSRTPKGSEVEILSPPSAVRSHLSRLGTETGGTRYQWLQDSFAGESWVYLRFALELP